MKPGPNMAFERTRARGFIFSDSFVFGRGRSPVNASSLGGQVGHTG